MGELSQTCWSRIRGNNVAFTKDKETVGNGKPQGCVRKETTAVSGTIEISVQKTTTQPTPSPEPSTQTQGVTNSAIFRSPGGRSPSGKISRPPCKELVRIHLVKSGIPQSACSTRPKRDSNSVISASLHTAGLMNSPAKGPKRRATKVQWPCCFRWCMSRHGAAEIFIDFTEELNHAAAHPMRDAKIRDQNPSLNKIGPGGSSSAQLQRSKI